MRNLVWSCFPKHIIFRSLHSFDQQGFHTLKNISNVHSGDTSQTGPHLSQVRILNVKKAILERATACGIDFVTKSRHPVCESGQSSRVGRSLTAKESLFRERSSNALSNEIVRFVTKLFYDLVCRRRVENVMLYRDILIIQLMEQT